MTSLALLLAAGLSLPAAGAAGDATGVVVLRVEPGSVAERAGLHPGDLLTSWAQEGGPAQGVFSSPFDAMDVELEQAPRGPVRVTGTRGDQTVSVSLFPDDWGLSTDPVLEEAWSAARAGRTEAALASLDEATTLARAAGRPTEEAHLLSAKGELAFASDRLDEAAAAFARAITLRRAAAPGSLALAASLRQLSDLAQERGKEMDTGTQAAKEAARLVEALAPRSLAQVRSLRALATASSSVEARPLLEKAKALAEELAPGSLLLAAVYKDSAARTSDLERKLALCEQALEIRERVAPEGIEVVDSLKQKGYILAERGEVLAAEALYRRALAIQERVAPGTRQDSGVLNNLALLRRDRGDLAEAETLYRRAMEITQRVQPESAWVALKLMNLANLLRDRGDLDEAEADLRRAVALMEKEAPRSDLAGYCLIALANVLVARDDPTAAESLLRRGIDVLRQDNPKDRGISDALSNLGDVFLARKRFPEARAAYEEALGASEARSPRSLVVSHRHNALAELAQLEGDLDTAERHHRAALALREDLAPGTLWEAESAHALGVIARARGRTSEALDDFRRAVSALETQSRHLGGDRDVQVRFRSSYQQFYRDLEELLLESGHREEAFDTVERSRARGLLALLSARDLDLAEGVPEELEGERRAADAEHDRILQQLASSRKSLEDAERAELRRKLDATRERQEDVRARIRAAAPRLASLRDPDPLDLAGVRAALDPGTLLLVYSVGEASARVYAVGPGPRDFGVFPLAATGQALRAEVTSFRDLIQSRRGAMLGQARTEADRTLTRLLLAPAAEALARADRVLIVPDGFLHVLPFSALLDPSDPGGRRYLVEAKPLHVASSVTLYARLVGSQPPVPNAAVVAFADPAYPRADGDTRPSPSLKRAMGAGLRLDPLPLTRREAAALQAIAPGAARIWLGSEATEERAKSVGRGARILHFACHGFLDEAFPLESGLALAIPPEGRPEGENGLLQAWEVFEGSRLDADLVTLSACQTGLGKETAGEGLLGLTWAFQYAGARSVLASLWEVNDASTADLMGSFYRHLARGEPKAQALRAAQVELLHRPATSSPYFWAAFQLVGGWR